MSANFGGRSCPLLVKNRKFGRWEFVASLKVYGKYWLYSYWKIHRKSRNPCLLRYIWARWYWYWCASNDRFGVHLGLIHIFSLKFSTDISILRELQTDSTAVHNLISHDFEPFLPCLRKTLFFHNEQFQIGTCIPRSPVTNNYEKPSRCSCPAPPLFVILLDHLWTDVLTCQLLTKIMSSYRV